MRRVQVGPLFDNNGVLLDSVEDITSSLNDYFDTFRFPRPQD